MLKNCIVMGAGRSGTSMVAGTLSGAGYFMGEKMLQPTPRNPKGYFESEVIEIINEDLLKTIVPRRPPGILGNLFKNRPMEAQYWLARVPLNAKISCSEDIASRIASCTQKQPFCFKDPRFSYTLPVWKPFLKNTVFICVFRHPAKTASSVIKILPQATSLKNFSINFKQALEVWTLMYRHILEKHRDDEEKWLFIHYNQVLEAQGIACIEKFIGGKVDQSFPDSSLESDFPILPISPLSNEIYEQLCKLARYKQK